MEVQSANGSEVRQVSMAGEMDQLCKVLLLRNAVKSSPRLQEKPMSGLFCSILCVQWPTDAGIVITGKS